MPLKNLPTNLLNPICLSGIILIFYFYSFLFLFSYILNYNFVSTSFFLSHPFLPLVQLLFSSSPNSVQFFIQFLQFICFSILFFFIHFVHFSVQIFLFTVSIVLSISARSFFFYQAFVSIFFS